VTAGGYYLQFSLVGGTLAALPMSRGPQKDAKKEYKIP